MRKIISRSFLAPLLAAAFLAGCGPEYYPGDHRYPGGGYGQYEPGDVTGTVESVNPRQHLIYIDEENGDNGEGPVVLSYDDGTVVRYQGQTYQPENLERGDRVQVSVDRDDQGRPFAESIDVLYDVSQGGPPPEPPSSPGGYDRDRGEDQAGSLRGIVRSVDVSAQTIELDHRGERVTVGYDDHTPVLFQGERYSPDNLERGDEIRVRVHDYDGRLFAQEITVIRDRRSRG